MLLQNDSPNAASFESEYGYEDELKELEVAKFYCDQLRDVNFEKMHYESAQTYKYAIHEVSLIIEQDSTIRRVINFGVSYAYIDSILAKKYPHIEFIGIDRSDLTKKYNEKEFEGISNLHFFAGDFFEFILHGDFGDAVLLHIRTLVVLPPNFIHRLYKSIYEKGFRYLIGLEQFGFSRQTHRVFEFSETEKPSVLFRDFMFIHNYPWLAVKNGFKPIAFTIVPLRLHEEDFHVVAICAKRV